MSTLAVIPARLAATRLPRKPLRLLGGLPLVVRVWETVSRFAGIDRCIVATDSAEVARAAASAGAECVLTSETHASGTDRVAEVAARAEFAGFDAIVNVQGDEPFVSGEAVAAAAALVTDGRFPLGTVAVAARSDVLGVSSVVKVVADDAGRALYFSRAPIPWLRDEHDDAARALLYARVRQHVGVYAYTPDALRRWVALPVHPLERIESLEQLRPLAAGIPIGVAAVVDAGGRGIDTEDDLAGANARWHASTDSLARQR